MARLFNNNDIMKPRILLLLVTALAFTSCARKPEIQTPSTALSEEAKKQTEIARETLLRAEKAAEEAALEKLKVEEATALKEKAEKLLTAPIRANEFQLTITPDSEVASAFGVPVHVFSTSSQFANQFKSIGSDAYFSGGRQGANVEKLTFGTSGKRGPATLRVPGRTGDDTLIIIANLPKPSGGDARVFTFPLTRVKTTNPLTPTAPPINIRLTRVGLLPG